MVKLILESHAGALYEVDVAEGKTVMEAAINNLIPGILGDCGGACSCATCHVYIDPDWVSRVQQPSATELEMLEMAVDANETSRLGCQIALTAALDGLKVKMPASQF